MHLDNPRAARPVRIVFFMLHPGYLRYFRPVIEILAARGHEIVVSVVRGEKDPGDARLVDAMSDAVGINLERAPVRRRNDHWRSLAALVRSLTDLARYSDPRYADAFKLRGRVRERIVDLVTHGETGGAVTRGLSLRLIDAVDRPRTTRATRRLQRLLATFERAIPTSQAIDAYLERLAPDLVLATPVVDFASPLVEYIKSAHGRGVASGVCVASWDNLTGKGLLRVVPDRVFVWNELQRQEAVELHGIPAARVVATGAPKFDEWFARRPVRDIAAFSERVGLPETEPYILYLCSSSFIAPAEVSFVFDWVKAVRRSTEAAVRDAPILVRPHPQNAAQWSDIAFDDRKVAIWPRHGAQPDSGEARADFFDSLSHAMAVVGVNTSALIEASILGKPVLTVTDQRFAGTQGGTLHFQYLRSQNGGFLLEASSWDDHLNQLARVVSQPDVVRDRAASFVSRFVRPRGLDEPAAAILARELENLALSRPCTVAAPTPTTIVLRGILRLLLAADGLRRSTRDSESAPLMDG
jgi:hypothetical protein